MGGEGGKSTSLDLGKLYTYIQQFLETQTERGSYVLKLLCGVCGRLQPIRRKITALNKNNLN